MINWMKYRWLYLLISGTVLIAGIFSMVKWGFKFGIDFTGGIVAEYKIKSGETKIFRYSPVESSEAEKQDRSSEARGQLK